MKKVFHYYTLTPEWQYQLAEQIGSKVIDNKIISVPESIGNGDFYFTEITPGISVLYMDLELKTPLKICRVKSESDLYIFHFDLSEHVNLIKINNEDYEIGSYDKLDLAIIDNQIESSFKPTVDQRTIAVRILVDKKLLQDFISKYHKKENYNPAKNKSGEEVFYHYGNIDSNSTLLLKSIKNKSVQDLSFGSLLKGVSLKLLGNFFNKFYDSESKTDLTEAENEALTKTKNYLLDNLYSRFPSVIFLAAMAGMSESKFKMAFKKSFGVSPNLFFIKKKMELGKKLLKSGNYHTLTEVIYELNYTKLSYFSSKYFELFQKRPIDDFVKNYRRDHQFKA